MLRLLFKIEEIMYNKLIQLVLDSTFNAQDIYIQKIKIFMHLFIYQD